MTKSWKTVWTAAALGPYPVGNVAVQPILDAAFPEPEKGAQDQTFRLILRPDMWGERVRVRFTNRWGRGPVVIDDAFVGLRHSSAVVVEGTNFPLTFAGGGRLVMQPGESAWSDAVALPYFAELGNKYLAGRTLAISFHLPGESGPMTWHSSSVSTSYVTWPKAGSVGSDAGESAFPFSFNSWFFIDAVDMAADPEVLVVVCFGDSLTDGSNSTLNGEDRWPDIFSRRSHAVLGDRISVVNAGIGGNQIVGPYRHTSENPYRGGPPAVQRAEYDVLSLSGVGMVIWLEGINDFSDPERTAAEVIAGMERTAAMWRSRAPGLRVIAGTVPTAIGATLPDYGTPEQESKRRILNQFIRSAAVFDGYIEFADALADPATGGLRPEFVPNSTRGGEGDGLHPNRAGKLKMVEAIDPSWMESLLLLRPSIHADDSGDARLAREEGI